MTATGVMLSAWRWLRENDLPNWVIFAFTVVLWPVALFAWQHRRANSIPGLEVHFSSGKITIGEQPHHAIDIRFTNHTGSVVYVSGVRIRNRSKRFYVPLDAARDIAGDSYHLKFIDTQGQFRLREITLQTNDTAQTCIPSGFVGLEFLGYVPPWYARVLRRRKYFILEYTAMVGTTRHFVATAY
jgi:hypothetical protein